MSKPETTRDSRGLTVSQWVRARMGLPLGAPDAPAGAGRQRLTEGLYEAATASRRRTADAVAEALREIGFDGGKRHAR